VTTNTDHKCDTCVDLAEALKAAKLAERESREAWKATRHSKAGPEGDSFGRASVAMDLLNMVQAVHVQRAHPETRGKRAAPGRVK